MEWTAEHYNKLLGLDVAWSVTEVKLNPEKNRVIVHLDYSDTTGFCGECGRTLPHL